MILRLSLPVCSPMGREWRHEANIDSQETGFDLGIPCGGRYWDRTSDLFGVNEALSR